MKSCGLISFGLWKKVIIDLRKKSQTLRCGHNGDNIRPTIDIYVYCSQVLGTVKNTDQTFIKEYKNIGIVLMLQKPHLQGKYLLMAYVTYAVNHTEKIYSTIKKPFLWI